MTEFACVCFNKVRLQYYVSKGHRKALWLDSLIKNPARLFSTTLVGVNVAMMISSECSRQFYSSLGLIPEIAPLTQVIIAITVGELAPMLAARRYPEHVAMLGMPLLYASSKIFYPLLLGIDAITKSFTWLIGQQFHRRSDIFISRDELQKILEQDDSGTPPTGTEDFNIIVSHIFGLREKTAAQIMEPINPVNMIPSNCTVAHMRHILKNSTLPYLPIYHRSYANVVGIAFPRDLIKAADEHPVRGYARPPWFLTQDTKIMEVLTQFRRNNQAVAIVLNTKGKAVGILTLNAMLREIFGKVEAEIAHKTPPLFFRGRRIIERTLPGEMNIDNFQKEFNITIDAQGAETLSQLVTKILGHIPEAGESATVGSLKLTVKETSLIGAKTITVASRRER